MCARCPAVYSSSLVQSHLVVFSSFLYFYDMMLNDGG